MSSNQSFSTRLLSSRPFERSIPSRKKPNNNNAHAHAQTQSLQSTTIQNRDTHTRSQSANTQSTIMQSERDDRPFVKDQDLLNKTFKAFRLSFSKPNRIAISLTAMKSIFSQTSQPPSPSTLSQEEWNAAKDITRNLWGFLEEISELETHRHRVDARNIMEEVQNRMLGLPATIVEPCPQFLPYIGPISPSHSSSSDASSSPTPEELEGIKGERFAGQATFPVPEGNPRKFIDGENDNLPAENTALSQLIMEQSGSAPGVLETLRKMGAANPGPPAPAYLDDPVESLIYYSGNFPLLQGPYPQISVPSETIVRPEVYDLRKKCCETQHEPRLANPDSYICKLVHRVQDTVLRPEVIFKYAIITRATRGRFLDPSTDDVENEPPATEEEVAYLIEWISKGFPKIFVRYSPNPPLAQNLLVCGEHDRNRDPSSIEINGDQLDAIEQSQSQSQRVVKVVGKKSPSPVHLIYQIYVTLFHELAHYLNTQINAPNNRDYLTPRKLRWELRPEGFAEYPEHPRHNVFSPHMGELGQLVEFLIFGCMVGVVPGRDELFARAWGTGCDSGAIFLPTEVVVHMLASRVPRWMDGPMLRELVRGYELQRGEAPGRGTYSAGES